MKHISFLLLALGSLLLATGCNRAQTALPPPKAPAVLVSLPIVKKEAIDYEELTGRTEAIPTVEIRAHVTGYLEKVNFKDGTMVKKGQVLFEIDSRPYQAELAKTEANVGQYQARVKRLSKDFVRAEGLISRRPRQITPQEFDQVRGDLEEARATLKAAVAARDRALVDLSYTKVESPINGRASRRYVDPGNLIKADDTLLTTIVNLHPMYAYFDVDERNLLRLQDLIRAGKIKSARDYDVPVELGLANEEGFPHPGKINFVDNKLDPGTGTLRLRGEFANADDILTPGLFARLRVQIGAPHEAILVAERALQTDQGQKYAFVVNDKSEVEYRPVQVGGMHDRLREIHKGLKPGENVVVAGMQRVRAGMKVEAKLVDMPLSTKGKTK